MPDANHVSLLPCIANMVDNIRILHEGYNLLQSLTEADKRRSVHFILPIKDEDNNVVVDDCCSQNDGSQSQHCRTEHLDIVSCPCVEVYPELDKFQRFICASTPEVLVYYKLIMRLYDDSFVKFLDRTVKDSYCLEVSPVRVEMKQTVNL